MTVIAHATTSLDGYLAGPGDAMDWVFDAIGSEPDPVAEQVMNSAGAFLSGRRSYDVGRRDSQEAFDGDFAGVQLVLSHRPLPADDHRTERLTGDVAQAVAVGLERARGRALLVAGGQVTRQVLVAGLLDEVVIHLAPVVLGAGVPFLDAACLTGHRLRPHQVSSAGNLATVRYRVERAPSARTADDVTP